MASTDSKLRQYIYNLITLYRGTFEEEDVFMLSENIAFLIRYHYGSDIAKDLDRISVPSIFLRDERGTYRKVAITVHGVSALTVPHIIAQVVSHDTNTIMLPLTLEVQGQVNEILRAK